MPGLMLPCSPCRQSLITLDPALNGSSVSTWVVHEGKPRWPGWEISKSITVQVGRGEWGSHGSPSSTGPDTQQSPQEVTLVAEPGATPHTYRYPPNTLGPSHHTHCLHLSSQTHPHEHLSTTTLFKLGSRLICDHNTNLVDHDQHFY